MIEIIITAVIVIVAIFILFKSIKSSKEGKCSGGCKNCHEKNRCSSIKK